MEEMVGKDFLNPLFTDKYKLTMAYAHFKNGRTEDRAVFDYFFRKNPFDGEFTVFAGLDDLLDYMANYKFNGRDPVPLNVAMREVGLAPAQDEEFREWLGVLDFSKLKVYAVPEGTIMFPRVPPVIVEGPLIPGMMLETALLNLLNFPSLVATKAARCRLAAGFNKTLVEGGLRRAQGLGGMAASKYAYMGGFDGTSNVQAGNLYGVPTKGTHDHSYIQSYTGLDDLGAYTSTENTDNSLGENRIFFNLVLQIRQQLDFINTNEGELAAMISYAIAYPDNFFALVDTYNVLKSGVPNFICVAIALCKLGYEPKGIRIDSGDLAYLAKEAKGMIMMASMKMNCWDKMSECIVVASNDIDEDILISLKQQDAPIDSYIIGTALATCAGQPALGGVYKLMEINGIPRIKISEDPIKITLPGEKVAYRLSDSDSGKECDLVMQADENAPEEEKEIFCRHPFDAFKTMVIRPDKVTKLHKLVWDGKRVVNPVSIYKKRELVLAQLQNMRSDHFRFTNPTPFKVSVSERLYETLQELRRKAQY